MYLCRLTKLQQRISVLSGTLYSVVENFITIILPHPTTVLSLLLLE